jgi:hypothetical protein
MNYVSWFGFLAVHKPLPGEPDPGPQLAQGARILATIADLRARAMALEIVAATQLPDIETALAQAPGLRRERDGYLVAPSLQHATTAAVLRSGWSAHRDEQAFAVNLTSARVHTALRVIDGIRMGQPLDALLGYRFERGLHDRSHDALIPAFRDRYRLAPGVDPTTTAAPRRKPRSAPAT